MNQRLEELERMLDDSSYLAWMKDKKGCLMYVNQTYAEVVGKNKEDIIGRKEEEIWKSAWGEKKIYLLDKGIVIERNESDLTEDNETIGTKGIGKMKNLEPSHGIEEKLEVLVEATQQLMCVIDEEEHIKLVGNVYKSLFGWNEKEMQERVRKEIGRYITKSKEYFSPRDIKEPLTINKRFPCKYGGYKYMSWSLTYVPQKNITLLIGHDITQSKREEETYLELQVEMELEYIKGELLACTSNEFKTPVNTILYAVELLQGKFNYKIEQELQGVDFDKYMELIKQNAYRLIKLINNLVDSNSIEAGQYELKLGNHNIVKIVREILESVQEYVQTKGIELNFKTAVEEIILTCDPEKIERIMLNLVSNAIKYSKENGKIQVELNYNKEYVYICVVDNGQGIPKEKLDIIFERFSQVEDGFTRKTEGSGIGLSIVKSLVEMHEGYISVNSRLDKGTEFRVQMPIRVSEERVRTEDPKHYKNNKKEIWNIEFADIYG
ncbi:MAG: ATP-binding protein [Cellulosilyticaceae bacterium]